MKIKKMTGFACHFFNRNKVLFEGEWARVAMETVRYAQIISKYFKTV